MYAAQTIVYPDIEKEKERVLEHHSWALLTMLRQINGHQGEALSVPRGRWLSLLKCDQFQVAFARLQKLLSEHNYKALREV